MLILRCNFTILLFLFISSKVAAAPKQVIGEVVKIRGQVTQLAPGQHLARTVLLGQKVKEDTSVVTGKRSFAKIRFYDGSLIFIGPKSKVVLVKMDKSGNGVVGLLKGKMRSKIKSKNTKKFYVRTRNAALGVRGTEFETVFNPENKITSLVTYKGEVAMARVAEKNGGLKRERTIKRDFKNRAVVDESETVVKSSSDQLDALLKDKATVSVKGGQLSQTVQSLGVVSQPIKISPVQVNALYKNEEYIKPKKSVKKLNLKSDKLDEKNLVVKSEAQSVPAEGVFNPEKKIFAAKSGGLFDLESGLYIPPGKDALFDQKNKVYVAQNIGSVDSSTGHYVAPLGLRLDPVEGFTAKKLKAGAPESFIARVKSQKELLNQNLAKEVLIATEEVDSDRPSFSPLSARELVSKNILSVTFGSFDQAIDQEQDSFLAGTRNFDAEDSREVSLSLAYASGSHWQPTSYFKIKKVEVPGEQRGSFSQAGDNLVSLGVGMQYSVSSRWGLIARVSLDQDYFLHHSSTTSGTTSSFIRVTTPKLDLGVTGTLIRSGRFSLESKFVFGSNLVKETGDHKVRTGYHSLFEISGRYWLSQQYFLELGLKNENQTNDTEGTTQVYSAKVSRKNSGALLRLGSYF